jgi:protein tyrosine phosphatase (PTP) superfamily phosphohydrolase (DUF442 family)
MSAAIEDIYNYRQADARLATSGQPSEEELAAIARAGYTVIVNLALHDDPRYSLPDEAGSVRALGLSYVHIPVQFADPREEDLLAFFAAMDRCRDDAVWVHCAANKRVSSFLGLYRRIRQGWTEEQSFAVQREIWQPNPVWQRFIDKMLIKYCGRS